jgi:uncharacterized protein YpmB
MQPPSENTTEQQASSASNPISDLPNPTPDTNSTPGQVPQPETPLTPLPVEPKKSKKKWIMLAVLVLIIGAALALVMALPKKDTTTPRQSSKAVTATSQKKPYMLITDNQKQNIVLADASGGTIYTTKLSGYGTYLASSPNRQIFMSSYDNSSQVTTYYLVDKDGKLLQINANALKLLTDKNNVNRTFAMLEDNIVLAALCNSTTTAENACKILQLNLITGDQKALVETNARSTFATGESTFNVIGKASDNKLIYIHVAGPTKLGSSKEALYSFNPKTSQATDIYDFPNNDRGVDNLTISPNGKTLIYDTQEGTGATDDHITIYNVDLGTKKETNVVWTKTMSGGQPFSWSQDSKKVAFAGFQELTGQVSNIGPLTLAYMDVSQNKITDLQTLKDSAHQSIVTLSWLNNSTLVYGLDTSTVYHDFTNSAGQIYKENLSEKTGTKLGSLSGHLIQVIY